MVTEATREAGERVDTANGGTEEYTGGGGAGEGEVRSSGLDEDEGVAGEDEGGEEGGEEEDDAVEEG